VYLAQKAAAEVEPEMELAVAAAASPSSSRPVEKKEQWFRSWRWAWVPAGALAVTITVAVAVRVRHDEIAADQAKAAREAAARATEMASTPHAPSMTMQAAPAPAGPAPTEPKKLNSVAPSIASVNNLAPLAVPPPVSDPGAMEKTSSNETAAQPRAAGAGYPATDAAVEYKPAPAPAARRQEQERIAGVFQSRSLAAEKQEGAKAVASANAGAIHGQAGGVMAAAAPMAQFDASSTKSGSAEATGRHREGGVLALYKAKTAALPSGLTALSTAMTLSASLAVDRAGGVFLSEDAGIHWESVAKQWSGRAVAVRLQTIVGVTAGTASLPPAVFEIVNDQGQVWTSTDGKIWKAK
jgi:hypothetical protein